MRRLIALVVSQCIAAFMLLSGPLVSGELSKSVVSGEIGSSRPGRPIMLPGIAPGRAVATGGCQLHTTAGHPSQSSVARLAARARHHATRDSTRAGCGRWGCQLHTAGHLNQSLVSRLAACAWRRLQIMRPRIVLGRAAADGVASCKRQAIRVSRQWRGCQWQLAPANYATRDSTRAGS